MFETSAWRQLFAEQERGATAVEYALIISLIAAVIVGVVTMIGPALLPGFQAVIDGLP